MPKLVITDDDGVREVALNSGDTLGRVASNAIQLKVAAASRTHCRFTKEGNAWVIEDLGSSNGTLLNGRKTMKAELVDGDEISLGTVTLRFLDVEIEDDDDEISLEGGWGDDEISLESKPYLVLLGAGRAGEVLSLTDGSFSVGRKSRHMIQLKDASVSGDHAELSCDGGSFSVKDAGSSNGTFVNGRRVEQAEVRDGDAIRFGTVECRFGVGDPEEAKRAAAEMVAASTQVVETAESEEEWGDELGALEVPRKGQLLGNLMAVLLILGLGGGVAFLAMNKAGGGGGASAARAGDHWSFELAEQTDPDAEAPELWIKLDPSDPGDFDESFEDVRSGVRALLLRRSGGTPGATLVACTTMESVTAGLAYRASIHTMKDAGAPTPLIEIAWFARILTEGAEGAEVAPIAVDRIRGDAPGSKDWSKLEGLVIAPEGASLARFSVGVEGNGRVLVDDAGFERGEAPAARVRTAGEFRMHIASSGDLRIGRIGRIVLDDIGLVFGGSEGTRRQADLWLGLPGEGGGSRGEIDGLGLEVAFTGESDLSFSGPAVEVATGLGVRLHPREDGDAAVTLHHDGKGTRYTSQFNDLPATAVTLGSRSDRLKLTLRDATGNPLELRVSLVLGDSPRLSLSFSKQNALGLNLQTSFEKEEAAAREAFQRAQTEATGNPGAAVVILEGIIADFPSPEGIGGQARTARDLLLKTGKERLDGLRAEVERSIFFKDLVEVEDLDRRLVEAGAAFRGTELATPLGKAQEQLQAAVAKIRGQDGGSAAERLFHRGRDYMERQRDELALFIFEELQRRHPDSEWAEQAAGFSDALRARIKEGR